MWSSQYFLDVLNTGFTGTACTSTGDEKRESLCLNPFFHLEFLFSFDTVASLLGTEEVEKNLDDQVVCLIDQAENIIGWLFEVCCNPFLWLTDCCLPFNYTTMLEEYTNPTSNVSQCRVSECATTFLEDLSYSFNHQDDPIEGSTFGIPVSKFPFFLFFWSFLKLESLMTFAGFSSWIWSAVAKCEEWFDFFFFFLLFWG